MNKTILIILLTLFCCACNSKKHAKRYYSNNKETLVSLRDHCNKLYSKYNLEDVTFRGSPLQVNIVLKTSNDRATGILFNRNSLEIDTIYYIEPFSKADKNTIESISTDSLFLKIVSIYQNLKPRAMKIEEDGIFIVLSEPFEPFSHYDSEGGIYVSNTNEFKRYSYIEKIDSIAYLIQGIVP